MFLGGQNPEEINSDTEMHVKLHTDSQAQAKGKKSGTQELRGKKQLLKLPMGIILASLSYCIQPVLYSLP